MIVMGLFLAFFGNKFVNFVIGLVGFLVSTYILLLASFLVLQKTNPKEWV
jgi:purine-cytosine permease-like protein